MLPILGIVLVPGILWGWFFYQFHRYKKVHIPLLIILFLGGMGSGFLALVLNHLIEKYTIFWPGATGYYITVLDEKLSLVSSVFWFFVGMNEEFAKLIVLFVVVFSSRHLGEIFDGILFVVVVSLGFAIMENFYYLDHYGITVFIMRTVITIPAHLFMSIPMGYFVAKSRLELDSKNDLKFGLCYPFMLIFGGWLFSSFLHGLYNFLLSLNMEKEAYYHIMLMGIFSFLFSKNAMRKSKMVFYKNDLN